MLEMLGKLCGHYSISLQELGMAVQRVIEERRACRFAAKAPFTEAVAAVASIVTVGMPVALCNFQRHPCCSRCRQYFDTPGLACTADVTIWLLNL